MADNTPNTDSARPDSRNYLPAGHVAGLTAAKSDSRCLNGVIRAALTANLQIDADLDEQVSDLLRNAVDGLLEAAELLSKRLARDLDMDFSEVGQ